MVLLKGEERYKNIGQVFTFHGITPQRYKNGGPGLHI